MFSPPIGDTLFPLFASQFMLIYHSRGEQAIIGQEAYVMLFRIEIAVFGLDGIGSN